MKNNISQINLFGESQQKFSLPKDYKPVCPDHMEVSRIYLTKGGVSTPERRQFVERFHQTVLNEFFRVAFRKKFYATLEEIQEDLDSYLYRYNNERSNQGARCQGRTPMQTFTESLHLVKEKILDEIMLDNATCQLLS